MFLKLSLFLDASYLGEKAKSRSIKQSEAFRKVYWLDFGQDFAWSLRIDRNVFLRLLELCLMKELRNHSSC